MAQRTEKEETEFKVVPETLALCVNNCGVVGNPATNNMCQKCFNATTTTSSTTTATQRARSRSGSLRSPNRSTSCEVLADLVVDRTVGGSCLQGSVGVAKKTIAVGKRDSKTGNEKSTKVVIPIMPPSL